MLPKIMPISKLVTLPISQKEVRVYAFKIAEEKILLLNKNSSEEELEDVLIELIQSKTEDVNVRSLTIVDIIVLLINIVDISRGLTRHFTYKCNKPMEDGKKCGTLIELDVDMANYSISNASENHKLVRVSDDIVCELEYPSYEEIRSLSPYKEDENEYIMRLYSKLIGAIYHGDDVHTDFTDEEVYEWALDLPHKALKEFEDFVMSIPTITVEYDVRCPKCGTTDHYKVNNIIDFFIYDTQTKM
jgi:hypothetical protein